MRIEKINPILEVLTYLRYRAIGKSVTQKTGRYSELSDEISAEFNERLEPIRKLENKLDEGLNLSKEELEKNFRPIDGDERGMSKADIIMIEVAHGAYRDYESETAIIQGYTPNEKRRLILSAMNRNNMLYDEGDLDNEQFLRAINEKELPADEKWKLIELYCDFDRIFEEVREIVRKAVDIVTENIEIVSPMLERFNLLYESSPLKPRQYFEHEYGISYSAYENETLFPWIFGYGDVKSAYSGEKEISNTFAGIMVDFLARRADKQLLPGDCDKLLKVLADNGRFEILKYLCDKKAYGSELAEHLGLSPNTVSHHINKLQSTGLIFSQAEGNRIYYSSNKDNIKKFLNMLNTMLLGK